MSPALFLAAHLVALLAIVVTAFAAGDFVVGRLLRGSVPPGAARAAWSIGVGFVLLATVGALLGGLGRLNRWAILGTSLLLLVAGGARLREILAGVRARSVGVAALLAAPWIAVALFPPLAFDETLYHLPFSRAFVETATLPFLPDLRFPVFPQLAEVLFAEVLAFGSDTAVHLVSLVATFGTAALVAAWASRLAGSSLPAAGWLAAAIWLGNPLVSYLSGTAYVEPLLALFVTASSFALWLWSAGAGRGWLALSALFAGAAAGTKYLGLFFVSAFALLVLVASARPNRPRGWTERARDFALFLVFAGLVAAPWYGRTLAFTGNPLFPFLTGIFGPSDWALTGSRALVHGLPEAGERLAAAGEAVTGVLRLPWDAVMNRERLNWQPPLSPAYFVGIPVALLAAGFRSLRRGRSRPEPAPMAPLLGAVLAFAIAAQFLPAEIRYVAPVLAIVGVFIAVELSRLARDLVPRSRLAAALLIALAAAPGWAYAAYRLALLGPPPLSAPAREAFLAGALPYYPATAFLNPRLEADHLVYTLFCEESRYYIRSRSTGDEFGPHGHRRLLEAARTQGGFIAKLREWGVDYLLLDTRARSPLSPADFRELRRLFQDGSAAVWQVTPPSGKRTP